MVRVLVSHAGHHLHICEECLAQIGLPPAEQVDTETSQFRQVFSLKAVHLLAFFILLAVGVEVTIGGAHIRSAALLINLLI